MTVHNTHVRTAIAQQRARALSHSGHCSFVSEILELNPFFPGLA
jgi:hypothetical protein